jgi:acyl-CoA reductase-like NAD-dependent aldehyde dehydrogenase
MIAQRPKPFHSLVAGRVDARAPQPVLNPATEDIEFLVQSGTEAMLDRAVTDAAAAFALWRVVPLAERQALLDTLARVVHEHRDHLAPLLTREQGKPLAEAQKEIEGAAALLGHYASMQPARLDELFADEDGRHLRFYRPLGVVAAIVPWNAPFFIAVLKIAPALLAGNAIIVKPAPTTPVTTLEFGRICREHVPRGLVQILADDGTIGPLLVAHPGVRKISFTGSTATGGSVMSAAARGLKRLTLELGGNDPAIVLASADPASAAAGIYAAAFSNAGQVCGAVKRVYAHDEIFEPFCAELAVLVERTVIGNGLDPAVTMGPLQNREQYRKAETMRALAQQSGRILAQARTPGIADKGYFVAPTVFVGLGDEHPLVMEEQFAPLLPVQRFSDVGAAIHAANATPFGLTASVWSGNEREAREVAMRLEAALICINRHNAGALDLGINMAKQSGSGWLLGDEGLKEYLQAHLLIK